MKPVRFPSDPAKLVKNHLAATLPAMVSSPAPTFGLVLPADWKPKTSVPALVVFDDPGPAKWPIVTRPLLRVTVWADGRDRCRTIAGAALAVLMSQPVTGVATLTDPSGLLDARDSNNGGTMASFTVRAQSRTLPA